MKRLLFLMFIIPLFLLTSSCDKDENKPEDQLTKTASLLKGTWEWSYSTYYGYDAEGKLIHTSTDSDISVIFTFDETHASTKGDEKNPYTLIEKDGKIFIDYDPSDPNNDLAEIISISSERMELRHESVYPEGFMPRKSVEDQKFSKL